jgi:hypothetical protein
MPDLLPNFAILRSPSNWFLVAFAMAILALVSHLFFKGKLTNG